MKASASLQTLLPDYLHLQTTLPRRPLFSSSSPKTDLGEDTDSIHLLSLSMSAATGHDCDKRSSLFSLFPFRARACCAPTHKLGCAKRPCSTQSGAAYLRGPVIAAAAATLQTPRPTIFAEGHRCIPDPRWLPPCAVSGGNPPRSPLEPRFECAYENKLDLRCYLRDFTKCTTNCL